MVEVPLIKHDVFPVVGQLEPFEIQVPRALALQLQLNHHLIGLLGVDIGSEVKAFFVVVQTGGLDAVGQGAFERVLGVLDKQGKGTAFGREVRCLNGGLANSGVQGVEGRAEDRQFGLGAVSGAFHGKMAFGEVFKTFILTLIQKKGKNGIKNYFSGGITGNGYEILGFLLFLLN